MKAVMLRTLLVLGASGAVVVVAILVLAWRRAR